MKCTSSTTRKSRNSPTKVIKIHHNRNNNSNRNNNNNKIIIVTVIIVITIVEIIVYQVKKALRDYGRNIKMKEIIDFLIQLKKETENMHLKIW